MDNKLKCSECFKWGCPNRNLVTDTCTIDSFKTETTMNLIKQILDCEYRITIAQMGYTSQRTKRKWLKRLKELKEQLKRKNYEQ